MKERASTVHDNVDFEEEERWDFADEQTLFQREILLTKEHRFSERYLAVEWLKQKWEFEFWDRTLKAAIMQRLLIHTNK